ncbi:MAG: 16S rRNA (guanine(966)-N(2))-methyltransferase RsmD [Bacteroidales bacterium]|nr:16S rRNA (guanine(966)-N(2))-methyltransferase RsmD [Bacteroidales bacterium]MCM1415377.1 16S rRNA (guanine(966)-N(2))-methyltransferase RsmD [bacterium]MCM1423310.1 16S rRNA (guanine(966)-N(2))-methyltransferase RsmD [bacterium]
MRVIAGTARSLRLKTPEGADTRPTTDRIKETLFNMLQPYLYDAVFVDLFAGSGGIGIEALSRGARHAYFAEHEKKALSCIRENLQFTHLADRATILQTDAVSALYGIHEKAVDVIFMDPPYDCGHEERVLDALSGLPFVTDDTLIVIEASLKGDLSYLDERGFSLEKEKVYKTNRHIFCRKK